MDISHLDQLTRLLQASISPIAMVSGVGLLILSQTNRFGRITDRLRELAAARRRMPDKDRHVEEQIEILYRRAKLMRNAISSAVACVLLATIEVLALFAIAVLRLNLQEFVLVAFAFSLLCLIVSLLFFLKDMKLGLRAIERELKS